MRGSRSACVDPEVKRYQGQDQGHDAAIKRAAGVGMQLDMTAWVSSYLFTIQNNMLAPANGRRSW